MPACARCGEINPDEARLCWSCGATFLGQGPGGGEERRVVSVLFVDLVDFTGIVERLDPEDLRRVQAPYFQTVRSELERFGGRVEKYIGDAVMALFGAPVAYGDDPERAVLAAFAILDAIEHLNERDPEIDLKVRIGVNTGEAFVDLDAEISGEGMALGDVVVTAFRLQQAAPVGGIFVGEATHRATSRTIEYERIEPVAAKGKPEPVRVWAAIGQRDPGGRPGAQLVGRNAELSYLRSLVAPPHDGLRTATLVAPPGMGKSRLVWELRESFPEDSTDVLWRQGRCLSYGRGVSFSAFAQIVKAHAGILESDPAEAVERKLGAVVASAVGDEAARPWAEAYLRPLVGLEGAERLSGDHRGEAFSAWRRFVEGLAASGRAVLVFEDLHWADDGLLDFIEHLCLWASELPLTIICTARPELRDRRPAWTGVVQLEPLSSDDTAELLGELMGRSALSPDVRDDLVARTAGNALYAEEFVRMLQERGGDVAFALPESVQAMIAARLDALHPEAKELLRAAAVLGTGFWVGALAHMSGLGAEQVERRLGELQWRELVRPQPRTAVADESQYAFWHVLVRDVAYSQIPRTARVDKHRAAAEWIESLAPGRGDLTELLAHHYASALEYASLARRETDDLTDRARTALRGAGEHALGVYAYAAAARYLREALKLWPSGDPARRQLLLELGTALFWSERGGDAELAEAHEALVAAGDLGLAAQAAVLLCRSALARGDRDAAVSHAAGAVDLLRGSPPSREQAEAVSNLAALYAVSGESGRALAATEDALELAEALSLDEIKAESLTFRGHARIVAGDGGGIADLEEAVELAENVRAPGLVRSCANLATSLVELGELERAWAVYERGRDAAARFGDEVGLHWLAAERPYEHYWRGRWDDALAVAEFSLREPDGGYVEHACRSVRAWIRLARGDREGALEDSAAALAFARRAKDSAALCQGLALRARVLAEAGLSDEAAPVIAEALAQSTESGLLPTIWTADLVDALAELGRDDGLEGLTQGRQSRTRWASAARRLACGSYVEAADEYAAIGARPEEAKARLRAAVALAAQGHQAAADAELKRARAFYGEVGAEQYTAAAEARLTALA